MSYLMRPHLPGVLGSAIVLLSACAGTTTRLAPLPPGAVEAEEEKQRILALQENERLQARLADIAYPILTMGTPLCPGDQGGHLGARFATIHNYQGEWQSAAARAFRLGDTLTVLGVTYGAPADLAGLRPGDRIVAVDNVPIQPGKESIKEFTALLDRHKKWGQRETSIALRRDGDERRATIRLNDICDYGSMVIQSGELNAFADGEMIYVTSTMMRSLSNDELRVVIAHEFAHNAMGHIKGKGAKAGAMVFSQDFEREADYVGLYALTLADLPLEAAPSFWRQMALADPKSIDFAHTHPTTAERFLRMEQTLAEIRQKVASRQTLLPNRKGSSEIARPIEPSMATTKSAIDSGLAFAGSPSTTPLNPLTGSTPIPPSSNGEPETQGYAPMREVSYTGDATPSPTTALQPGSGRSTDLVMGRPRLKAAFDDLIRLGMVTEYQEIRPGLLHLIVGDGLTQQSAVEFQLALLYEAYGEVSGGVATFGLFRSGVKIGEYTKDGLTINR